MGQEPAPVLYNFLKFVHRSFPFLVPDPDYKRLLQEFQSIDASENARSLPPEDEFIDLRCVWVVEVYTPSQANQLLAGLISLGWDRDETSLSRRNPVEWVRHLRDSPHGGAWLNLGIIRRDDEKRPSYTERIAPLPQHVSYATGALYGLTSSITCMVMGFVLDQHYSVHINNTLRRTFHSQLERTTRGYRSYGPDSQKRTAVQKIRDDARKQAIHWFQTFLPGLFASSPIDRGFLTCEFITLRIGQAFAAREDYSGPPREYLHLIDMDHGWDAWKAHDNPGLKFAWPASHDVEKGFQTLVAMKESDVSEEDLRMYGGPHRNSYSGYLTNRVEGLFSHFGLIAVLSQFERHLSAVRDSIQAQTRTERRPLRLLDALRRHIIHSVDVSAVSTELVQYSQKVEFFKHDIMRLTPVEPDMYRNRDIELSEVIRQTVNERAARLQKADQFTTNLLAQYGAALAAVENIKLQGTIRILTWVLVGLTVVLVVLTAVLVSTGAA